MADDEAGWRARALAAACEPLVGSVYFSPECHAGYAELGFDPSPGPPTDPWGAEHWGPVAMTDMLAYFASRGSLLGDVPGEVVAATFGVFAPPVVVEAVGAGRAIADAATIGPVRTRGAVAQLVRVLGERPEGVEEVIAWLARADATLDVCGRPLYAGVLAQGLPDVPVGRAWRLAERLREHRGDAHVAAFRTAGFDGCAIQVLTERVAGMPPRTYSRTRAWTDADLTDAEHRLAARGLLADDGTATEAGRAAREEVERATDQLDAAPAAVLDDDLVALLSRLRTWDDALRAAHAYYPSSPQEAVMVPAVQQWVAGQGLAPFPGVPA